MQKLSINKDKLKKTGIFFVLCFLFLFLIPQPYYFEAEVVTENQNELGQIYWNIGSGYKEEYSIKENLKPSENKVIKSNIIFSQLRSVRIDPILAAGAFKVIKVSFKSFFNSYELSGKELYQKLNINKTCALLFPYQNILVGKSIAEDPWMEINEVKNINSFPLMAILVLSLLFSFGYYAFISFKKNKK